MGKKSPSTPDIVGAANVEGEFSRESVRDQTYANRADEYGPFGNTTWEQQSIRDPSTGEMVTKWISRNNLGADTQNVFDAQMQRNVQLSQQSAAMGDRIQDDMGTALDWGQFGDVMAGPSASGPVGTGIEATTGDDRFAWDSPNRQRAEDAAYARSTQRLDPQFAADRTKLERQMANRGLRVGDSAYDSAMTNYDTGRNDAYEMARLSATGEGRIEDQQSYGQAQGTWGTNRATEQQQFGQQIAAGQNDRAGNQQAFDQSMDANARANALRQQQIQEYLGKRGQSLLESNALQDSMNIGEATATYGGG